MHLRVNKSGAQSLRRVPLPQHLRFHAAGLPEQKLCSVVMLLGATDAKTLFFSVICPAMFFFWCRRGSVAGAATV